MVTIQSLFSCASESFISASSRGALPLRKPFISTSLMSSSTFFPYLLWISLQGIVMPNSIVPSSCFVSLVFIRSKEQKNNNQKSNKQVLQRPCSSSCSSLPHSASAFYGSACRLPNRKKLAVTLKVPSHRKPRIPLNPPRRTILLRRRKKTISVVIPMRQI